MILQLDVDGVLADFTAGFARILDPESPVTTGTETKASWDDDLTPEQSAGAWAVVKGSRYFWSRLAPIPSAEELRRLFEVCREHDAYFVTARLGYKAKEQTEAWLRAHVGCQNPSVIVTRAKAQVAAAIGADYALEDNATNAIAIAHCARTKSYLVDRHYNQFDESRIGARVRRVKTLGEFLREVA